MSEPLANCAEWTFFCELELRPRLIQPSHRHKTHEHGIVETFRVSGIKVSNSPERSSCPPLSKLPAHFPTPSSFSSNPTISIKSSTTATSSVIASPKNVH